MAYHSGSGALSQESILWLPVQWLRCGVMVVQGACGRAVVRAAIVIVALIVGAGWSSVSAQSGGIVATPVIPGDPGGLAPASVDVVVRTADGLPLPAQGELCVGRQCQSIGGLESGRRVSFTDLPHGWVEVTVRV